MAQALQPLKKKQDDYLSSSGYKEQVGWNYCQPTCSFSFIDLVIRRKETLGTVVMYMVYNFIFFSDFETNSSAKILAVRIAL
jgi:hypothetical protein